MPFKDLLIETWLFTGFLHSQDLVESACGKGWRIRQTGPRFVPLGVEASGTIHSELCQSHHCTCLQHLTEQIKGISFFTLGLQILDCYWEANLIEQYLVTLSFFLKVLSSLTVFHLDPPSPVQIPILHWHSFFGSPCVPLHHFIPMHAPYNPGASLSRDLDFSIAEQLVSQRYVGVGNDCRCNWQKFTQ